MYLNQCLEMFITEKKLDDCTSSTITFYEYTVKKLISFIQDIEGDDIPVNHIYKYIKPYFLSLKTNTKLSPHSYNTFIRGVKVFTRFLFSEG
jgi:hypothetical protein